MLGMCHASNQKDRGVIKYQKAKGCQAKSKNEEGWGIAATSQKTKEELDIIKWLGNITYFEHIGQWIYIIMLLIATIFHQ